MGTTREVKEIQSLPPGVFGKVLSYLNKESTQKSISTNRRWTAQSIYTAKEERFSSLQSFINFLCENLGQESCATQREQLLAISSCRKIFDSVNLVQVKSSIQEHEERILNILKDLKTEDLKLLKELSKDEPKPDFFEDALFDLAEFYQTIDADNAISDDDERSFALMPIPKTLVEKGRFAKAVEVLNMIPDDFIKEASFMETIKAILEQGSIDKAIEAVDAMPDTVDTVQHRYCIIKVLAEKGETDKAIEVTYAVLEEPLRGEILENIETGTW